MARVVVTGGAGKLGRACGCVSIGCLRRRIPGAAFIPVDLTNYGQDAERDAGVEEDSFGRTRWVHLAAVPAPG